MASNENHIPVLAGKLKPPRAPGRHLVRDRLLSLLDTALQRRAALIAAPAGYGKTTLVSQWLARDHTPPAAWLSLDAFDNEPTRFFAGVFAAIDTVVPGVTTPLRDTLALSPAPAPMALAASLVSVLDQRSHPLVLVLDDYHVIEEKAIHDALLFLLTHTPDNLHVCVSTRSDPPLPLGRLRSLDQLVELRAAQLTMSTDEARRFLELREVAIADAALRTQLIACTEGWVTALQLASLSLRNHPNPVECIERFSGSHRTIADYLVEEVLRQLPADMTDFLMQTSLLAEMCADLCREVTGDPYSGERLNRLERDNLFVLATDEGNEWFRYHHLFRQLLRERLKQRKPHAIETLHHRACDWFETRQRFDDALEHALCLSDPSRAMGLIDKMVARHSELRFIRRINDWIDTLPPATVTRYPRLGIYRAGLRLRLSDSAGATREITAVRSSLASAPNTQAEPSLAGRLALLESSCALLRGEVPRAIAASSRALQLLDERHVALRCRAASLRGALHIWHGEGAMDAALADFDRAIGFARAAGSAYAAAVASFQKSIVLTYLGRLTQARSLLEHLAAELDPVQAAYPAITGNVFSQLAEIAQEQGDDDEALNLATKGLEYAQDSCEPLSQWWSGWCLARNRFFAGALDDAVVCLDTLTTLGERAAIPFWFDSLAAALRLRILVDTHELGAARAWARSRGLDALSPPVHAIEAELVALSRLLLAEGKLDQCEPLLARLESMAGRTNRFTTIIEIRLVQARLFEAQGDRPRAVDTFLESIDQARHEHFRRVFMAESDLIAQLQLDTSAVDAPPLRQFIAQLVHTPAHTNRHHASSLTQLSEREVELLRMIAHGFSNVEIAEKLFISINTVKTHLKRINSKLGTANRTQAVAEARIAGILS